MGLVCPRRGGRHRGRHGDAPPPSVDRSAGRRLDTVAAFASRPHPRPPRFCEPSVSTTPRGEVARKYRVGKLPRPSRPRPAPPSIGDWCLGVCALPPPLPPCAPREPCVLRGLGAWTVRAVRPRRGGLGTASNRARTPRARGRETAEAGASVGIGNGAGTALRTACAPTRARARGAVSAARLAGGASAVAARIGDLGAGVPVGGGGLVVFSGTLGATERAKSGADGRLTTMAALTAPRGSKCAAPLFYWGFRAFRRRPRRASAQPSMNSGSISQSPQNMGRGACVVVDGGTSVRKRPQLGRGRTDTERRGRRRRVRSC